LDFEKSGIRARRIADERRSIADLGAAAAKNCLAAAGRKAADLGLVIVASGSWEKRFPGPSAAIACQLGIEGVPCLDVPMASAGSLFGLSVASRLAGQLGSVLVIAAEKMSAALREPLDKNTSMLFGDGAGACLVASESGMLEVIDSVLHSDGAYEADLRLELDGHFVMNGQTVIMQAARKIPAVISELLEKHAVKLQGIQCFLVHQANQNLIL
jgi:3-oxoacyl-[acyl-carrier-protein] synthase-3